MSREKNLERLQSSLRDTQEILGNLISGTGKDAGKRLHEANKKLQRVYDSASDELEDLMHDTSKDVRKQYEHTSRDIRKQYASSSKDFNKQAAKVKHELSDRFADTKSTFQSAMKKGGIGAGVAALASKADLGSKAADAAGFVAKTGLATKAASKATSAAGFIAKTALAAKAASAAAGVAGLIAKTGLAAKAASMLTDLDLKHRTANLLENAAGSFVSVHNRLDPSEKLEIRHEKDVDRVSKAGYFVRFSALAVMIISKRHQLMALATQAYDKLKDSESRAQLTQDAKDQFDTMRRLMKAYANGQYREFPYRSLVKVVAAVIYFVSVADLVPDFIPVLGLTDDLAILAWVFSSVKDDLQQFVDWEAAEEKRRSRLARQSQGRSSSESSKSSSESSKTDTTASSNDSVANVGNANAAQDRKATPNANTTTDSAGNKATVTTGTSGISGESSAGTSGSANRSGGSSTSGQ